MLQRKVLEGISRGATPSELSNELNIAGNELRAIVRGLKLMGLPVGRQRGRYVIRETSYTLPSIRSTLDVLSAMKAATKVLRFFYGEDVRFLWPNKVLLRGAELLELKENEVLIKTGELEDELRRILVAQIRDAMRGRKPSEIVRTLNLLLYEGEVDVTTRSGEKLRGKIESVDIEGKAKIGDRKVSLEEVSKVEPVKSA